MPTQAVSRGSLTDARPHSSTRGESANARAASKATTAPRRGNTVRASASIIASIARPEGKVEAQLPKGSQSGGRSQLKPPISQ